MPKISKSNTTPKMEQRAAEGQARLNARKSKHFEVGTYAIVNRELVEVVSRSGTGFMSIRHQDGTVTVIKPFALQHEGSVQ